MVVNVIRWRPWLPTQSRKFEAAIAVRGLKGLREIGDQSRFTVEIQWKGSKKGNVLRGALSRKVKRNCTKAEPLAPNGVVSWDDDEFIAACSFSSIDGSLCPYEVVFFVFNGSDRRSKSKVVVAGPASLNLAEFASTDDKQELEINVPLASSNGGVEFAVMQITVHLMELRTNQEPAKSVQRSLTMPLTAPLSPCFGGPAIFDKDEDSTPRKGLRKMKSLTEYISSRRKSEANSDGKFSTGSDDSEYNDSFDSDSLDSSCEDSDSVVPRNSFGYGTLVSANFAGGGLEDDDFVYYGKHKEEVGSLYPDKLPSEVSEQSLKQSPKLGILTWRKRKVKSPKGEPLLKKEYGERGGDDIDFDRYQLSSSDELPPLKADEFGDDRFSVGSWECKEVVSRDGLMKLRTQVFFASIDQRNEKAAGESACTALVAVITDWLHSNRGEMPIKSELDSLIRDGSLEWRNLCGVDDYMARFPDKHFDLETVLEAGIRPISVVPETSFVGFFQLDGLGFLDGAMSFDSIWDEITRTSEPRVFIVSWNDHFFVLKVDIDAYYVIDTLGERLYEGCNQAYVLKFDKDATIRRVPSQPSEEGDSEAEETVVSEGKEACKEYIKSFLAAIPIRELEDDIKKGRVGSTPLHHRLQIEFHHTESLAPREVEAETDAAL